MKNITRAIKMTAADIVSRMGMRGLIAYTKLLSLAPGGAQMMAEVIDRSDNGLFDRCHSILALCNRSEELHRAYRKGGTKEAIRTYRLAFRYLEMYNTVKMIAYMDEDEETFLKREP